MERFSACVSKCKTPTWSSDLNEVGNWYKSATCKHVGGLALWSTLVKGYTELMTSDNTDTQIDQLK